MVDRLVQMSLLERVEDPHDRRAKQVTISAKGRALIEKGVEARNRWAEELASKLTAEQRGLVVEALAHLANAAGKLEPKQE